ncbi:MAG: GNAT family N-acetyltransferase [Anaerolineae bacterium]
MKTGIRIREVEMSDAAGIARVHVAAWRSAYRGLLPDSTLDRLSVEETEEHWRQRLADPWGDLLVLTRGEQIVAFVGYGPTHDEGADAEKVGEIYVLYVAPDEWRRGHGMALTQAALDDLRAGGRTEALLWVLHDNERAIAFYEATGFLADGTTQVKERRDGTRMTVARYRRRL